MQQVEVCGELGGIHHTLARLPLVSSHCLRSRARFFASSMSIISRLRRVVVDAEFDQTAGVGGNGGFAQLQRVHFTQAFEAGDG